MGIVRVASGVVSALQGGCVSGVQALLAALSEADLSDGGGAAALSGDASDLSGGEAMSGDALTDEALRGDMGDVLGTGGLDDLLDELGGGAADINPDELLHAVLAALGGGASGLDPAQVGQLVALYVWMVGAWLTAAMCKCLLAVAMGLDPTKTLLLLAERKLHLGLGAVLVRGLCLLLPAFVLPLRLPWLRSMVVMALRRERGAAASTGAAGGGGWWRWWQPQQHRVLEQHRAAGSGAGSEGIPVLQAVAGIGAEARADLSATTGPLTPLSGPPRDGDHGPAPRGEGQPQQQLPSSSSSLMENRALQLDAACSTARCAAPADAVDGQGGRSDGRVVSVMPSEAASCSAGKGDRRGASSGAAAATVTPLPPCEPGSEAPAAASPSTAPAGVGGGRVFDGWRGRPPESSRFAVNVLRTSALLGTSVAAALLPSNRSAPWLLTMADMAAAAGTVLLAIAALIEVWKDNDRGYLFENDAERAIKLSLVLLVARAGIEVALGLCSGKWSEAYYSLGCCAVAWQSCGPVDLEPANAYFHMFYSIIPVLNIVSYIRIVL